MQKAPSGEESCHLFLWQSGRKSNKKRPRAPIEDKPNPKRKCSARSKVAGTFTSGITAALIRESFPEQKGVVVSETAPVPENLFNMSLDKILSNVEWEPTVDLVEDSVRLEPVEPVPDVEPEKEKERSKCLRSTAPRRVKRKPTKKRRIRTQCMIEEGLY